MKVGDLIKGIGPDGLHQPQLGIVIEVIENIEVPPVVKVLWPGGAIDKEWTDELEVIK